MTVPYLQRLQETLAELTGTREKLAQAAREVAERRFDLACKEAKLLVAGVDGKNEAERKAHLFQATDMEQRAVVGAETTLKYAQRDYDIAEAQFSALRYELRAQELTVRSMELRATSASVQE